MRRNGRAGARRAQEGEQRVVLREREGVGGGCHGAEELSRLVAGERLRHVVGEREGGCPGRVVEQLTDAEFGPGPVAPQLVELLPRMLTFALSFAVIGRYWTVHHQLFARFDRADARMTTLNLGYLFGIAFLPFPTSLLGGHGDSTAAVVR